MAGPLQGVRVIEMAAIGPVPFCAMMMADMGADVIRVDRKASDASPAINAVDRGRRSIAVDLKQPAASQAILKLIETADVLIEGFRPGVMERLGLSPEICHQRNPRLIYGRMTGWGQHGPLALAAGHDLNYIAITGAVHAMGHPDRPPTPPLHLVGDMAGGAMMLAFGIVSALFEAGRSGKGQVIDAAICDGVACLTTLYHGMRASGTWTDRRSDNLIDGGAPFYGCYECADGKYVSIGALEPQFYALLMERCGLDDPAFGKQMDKTRWPQMKEKLCALFRSKTRDEWCSLLQGTDACFSPVLDWDEATRYPHNVAREVFVEIDGLVQPAPAPRFSRTPGCAGATPKHVGQHTREVLSEAGLSERELDGLIAAGAI
jgi:alpha-methylacyl-CoA racemase